MSLRVWRDVAVVVMLAVLPVVVAGCAAAKAQDAGYRPVPQQPPTAGTPAESSGASGMDAENTRSQELQRFAQAERQAKTPRATGSSPGRTGLPMTREQQRLEAARTELDFRRRQGDFRPEISELVPAQSMPALHEELWVIQRAKPRAAGAAADAGDDAPGTGGMVVPAADGKLVPIPLKHTDVRAAVLGHVATVDVTQQFHNPYDGKIEAVYVFPLPHNAAVNEFVMTVGERKIRGIIREREEAKQVYEQAKRQGYVASLMEQDRPNVFTQKVANIEPGKRIDVSVRYFHTLGYSDGWYEWAFPMVVGPRFNPPGTGDGVGAVGRGGRGKSGQKTEVQYLRPAERSGHDVAVAVSVDALVPVEAVVSRSHKIKVERPSERVAAVTLDAADRVPNKDFVLRWKVAGEGVQSGLVVQRGNDGGNYFAMTVVPPAEMRGLPRSAVEMVFVLDVSGSMNGRPIEQAKGAVRWALRNMRADDTLQVVRFAGDAEQMAERPVPATRENVRRAVQYIEGSSAGGGTMMLEGLRRALGTPADESRPRYVVFLTDGYIGNEAQILGELQRTLGGSRVFAMGVGSSPNRYLMEHMAKLGRGAVAYVGASENAEDVMAEYFGAISHPAMTDLAVAFDGGEGVDVFPRRLPDLFVGRPVTVVGRIKGETPRAAKVTGKVRGKAAAVRVEVTEGEGAGGAASTAALPAVWARMKLADLGDRLALEPGDGEAAAQVKGVALEYGLLSSFTAFVAVDSLTRTAGDHGTTVATPVPVPDGVRYETTVPE